MTALTLKVLETTALTPDIKQIVLADPAGARLPGFSAGAHVKIHLPDASERHYSLVHLGPDDPQNRVETYRLAVLLEPQSTGGSKFMHGLQTGDSITCSPPQNDFELGAGPAVLVAGGIGVTPLASMAATLERSGREYVFYYAGRHAPSLALVPELQNLCGPKLHLHYDDTNPLDLAGIFATGWPVFVCGPKGMIEAVKTAADAAGLPADQLHFELFTTDSGGDSFEVELASDGSVHQIPPDKTIIEVLEAAGYDPLYDCQRGDCGICQVDVLEGIPDHRDVVLSDAEKAGNKVMQICVSRAKTERLKLDI